MIAAKKTLSVQAPPGSGWLENTLLCVVLGLIVLRTTIIETPLIDQIQTRLMLSSEVVSLLLSTALLACFGVWLFAAVLRGRLHWRKTGFGIGVGLFILAGIVSVCFASNKRAAITDLTTLSVPMLTGMLLIQLLTSRTQIRLALFLIVAVGVSAAVQCFDQQMSSNQTLIEDYEANPIAHLEKMNIAPDSMEHWMYEHRLYSKDIRGFLMTSNSAATFFIMAAFAGLGLCVEAFAMCKRIGWRKWLVFEDSEEASNTIAILVCYTLAFIVVLLGLCLTQSKGGIGAFILGLGLFVILSFFGPAIWKRRVLFGTLLLILIVVAAGLITHYGIEHDRLPGGNSMLVRWQYWVSAAEMTRDHLAVGVGGGNFPDYYTHYKIPAASETVQNPHCWPLSLLSQYGIIGFAAFVLVVVLGICSVGRGTFEARSETASPKPIKNRIAIAILAVASLILLFVRPMLVDAEFLYQQVDVRAAAYIILYLVPAALFMFAGVLLWAASLGETSIDNTDRLTPALLCGLFAVLIHNLIDFAIFEPGNFSVFWLLLAVPIAQSHNKPQSSQGGALLDPSKRLGLFAGLVMISVMYGAFVLLPPVNADSWFRRVMGDGVRRAEWVDKAIAADTLSAKIPFRAANFTIQVYQSRALNDPTILDQAAEFADIAIQRNPADFKNWRLRAKINVIRSEQTDGEVKQAALLKAFEDLQQAIVYYPGSGKLHCLIANVAEQLGKNDVALCHYQTAVDIEDAYRAQFRIMYPDRETVISRLGTETYAEAKVKIEELRQSMSDETSKTND